MGNEAELELQMAGLRKQYDYTNYAHTNHINVIPEEDFKRLVSDTFKTTTDTLRRTYGPYGSSVLISEQAETITTKDGYNVYQSMGFTQAYKKMVYRAINKIITRVNKTVGDGTTSCMLMAEKLFNHMNDVMKTPDEKRRALDILSSIEKYLQNPDEIKCDVENGAIVEPNMENIKPVIAVASNYDDELTNILYTAMNPLMDNKKLSVRNVLPRASVDLDYGSNAEYEAEFLPGDYRIGASSFTDTLPEFNNKKTLKCVIYDHTFNSTDWLNFKKNWDVNEEVLIIAKEFNSSFLAQDWKDFVGRIEFNKKAHDPKLPEHVNAYLFGVLGSHKQDEIKDLAAVIGTTARNLYDKEVDFTVLPSVTVSMYRDDCLVFYNVKDNGVDTKDYIKSLELSLSKEQTQSYVKHAEIKKRIRSIKMEDKDTILNVRTSNPLEAKLIKDKIDDCIHIVESVVDSGIVPNLFRYVYYRIHKFESMTDDALTKAICDGIKNSIKGLFEDIWVSKYGRDENGSPNNYDEYKNHSDVHFEKHEMQSFDIITEQHCPLEQFATSAQYDLEVVAASIAIVKYLLDGRAFIFDANLLPTSTDDARYV